MTKRSIWVLWALGMVALSGYLALRLFGVDDGAGPLVPHPLDKSAFLIGDATHGHHQIELACGACHTDPFGGGEVLQAACVSCHGTELKLANDSHPKSKFTDPRNADRLADIDARQCVACHREHQLEQTRAMGVTQPGDFCFHCHQEIAQERPSHAGMGFDTCASAGCHNYHDNRALYEDFLVKHAAQPKLLPNALLPARAAMRQKHDAANLGTELTATAADGGSSQGAAVDDWAGSAHAAAGINCSGCHGGGATWQEKPALAVCRDCHAAEAQGFFQGKHGMRLNPELPQPLTPMTPAMGRLAFKPDSAHSELNCNSCHDPHRVDLRRAAVDSCLGCHDDDHSRAYLDSPHHALWQAELAGSATAGSGVSCASCHLPRETHALPDGERIVVNHNQNANLRPNEKMIRGVCSNCHGVGFAIDALADPALIRSNFRGKPARHIESIEMAVGRLKEEQSQ